jgi:cytochrome c oxidase subunit 2
MKRPPQHALQIDVIGKHWMWKVQHPGGQREIGALHVPTGVPIKLVMTSEDVIHDFFVPAFRIKQDVLPGAFTTEWFIATQPGSYHLFCSEYCGTSHAQMGGTVTVMTPEDYQSWLAGIVPGERPADAGARLFVSYGCVQCHSKIAPTMAGLYNSKVQLSDGKTVIADEEYLRESILEPAAKIVRGYAPVMPSYSGHLSEEQVMQLIAFIEELSSATTQPADHANSQLPIYQLPNLPPAGRPPTRGQP